MVRILRVKQAGTGSGGTGNPKAVPGATAPAKSGSYRDPDQLRAFAAMRAKARAAFNASIGSKGRL